MTIKDQAGTKSAGLLLAERRARKLVEVAEGARCAAAWMNENADKLAQLHVGDPDICLYGSIYANAMTFYVYGGNDGGGIENAERITDGLGGEWKRTKNEGNTATTFSQEIAGGFRVEFFVS